MVVDDPDAATRYCATLGMRLPTEAEFEYASRVNSTGQEHIYQQTYLCNPVPGGAGIVDWAAIERCRFDYEIERVHLEADDFGPQFTSELREAEARLGPQMAQNAERQG